LTESEQAELKRSADSVRSLVDSLSKMNI
jgi:hypothetical protein